MKRSLILVFVVVILLSGCRLKGRYGPLPYPTLVVPLEGTIEIQCPKNGAVVTRSTEFEWVEWKPLVVKDSEGYHEKYKVLIGSAETGNCAREAYTFERHFRPDPGFFSYCGGKVFTLEVTKVKIRETERSVEIVNVLSAPKQLFVWQD